MLRSLNLVQALVFHPGLFDRLHNAHSRIRPAARAAAGLGAIIRVTQLGPNVEAGIAPADIAANPHRAERLCQCAESIGLEGPRADHDGR